MMRWKTANKNKVRKAQGKTYDFFKAEYVREWKNPTCNGSLYGYELKRSYRKYLKL